MKPVASRYPAKALNWFAACLCMLALLLPVAVMAQQPGLTAADRADIKTFTINEDVFGRIQAVVDEGRRMHIKRSKMDMRKVHSLDDMAKQLVKADPRVKALLAKHGFTPRQFLVADLATVGTVMAMQRAQATGKVAAVAAQLNPANVQFYKSHKAAMDALVRPAPAAPKPSSGQ
ncbi:MAG TPA: hypothetical protein VFJ15_05090 [Oleiagrimonas sp.]|nr:hypothetical protein [Oleiagrimonas sp.]